MSASTAFGHGAKTTKRLRVNIPSLSNVDIGARLGLGIALLHFTSSASQWAGKIKWSFGADAAKLRLPEGYEAIASCKV